MGELTPPVLIGITGDAGAGKTTAAKILVEVFNAPGVPSCPARVDAFAAPLKAGISAMFGVPVEDLDVDDYKKTHPSFLSERETYRFLMQTLGTEWGRDTVDRDLWTKLARDRALAMRENWVGTIFGDVRFDNEARMIRDLGGLVVRVVRPGDTALSGGAAAHASESGVNEGLVDVTVLNTGKGYADLLIELQRHVLSRLSL